MPTMVESPKTRSRSNDVEAQGSFYAHPETGERFIRVTHITGMVKNFGLENWKININRAGVRDAAVDVYREIEASSEDHPPPTIFGATVDQRINGVYFDKQKADAAADVGSLMHDYISATLLYELGAGLKPKPLPKELQPGFDLWDGWRNEIGFEPLCVEDLLWNHQYKYAGRRDAKGKVRDGRIIQADWKTSGDIYPNYCWQVAAYDEADKDMGHGGADAGVIVLIPVPKDKKKVEFKTLMRTKEQMAEDFTVFRACLHIYRWQERCGI